MAEQKLYQAPADWLESAVKTLREAGVEVLAPTATGDGDVELASVASGDGAVAREYVNLHLPLKRLFFPETEVLLEYDQKGDGDVDLRTPDRTARGEAVIIGCRPCDAAAIDVLDQVFEWDYEDTPYASRREKATVVAFACTEPDEHCFCTSVGGSPQDARGSDVLVLPAQDGGVLMQVSTPKGHALVERLGLTPAPADAAPAEAPQVEARFDPEKIKAWLDDNFDSEDLGRGGAALPGLRRLQLPLPDLPLLRHRGRGDLEGRRAAAQLGLLLVRPLHQARQRP